MIFPECADEPSLDAIGGRQISRELALCAFLVFRLQVPLSVKRHRRVSLNSNNPFHDLDKEIIGK